MLSTIITRWEVWVAIGLALYLLLRRKKQQAEYEKIREMPPADTLAVEYVEKPSAEPEPPAPIIDPETEAAMVAALEHFATATSKPCIYLEAIPREDNAPTASKLGGIPYMPPFFEYPLAPSGAPLKLMAQLNFATLPPIPDFPTAGILQIYLLPDDTYGLNLGEVPHVTQDTFRIIYHPPADDYPEYYHDPQPLPPPPDPIETFPIIGEFQLIGRAGEDIISYEGEQFRQIFKHFCHAEGYAELFAPYFAPEHTPISGAIDDLLLIHFDISSGNNMGGHPSFTQYDPRPFAINTPAELRLSHDTLLLQLESIGHQEYHSYIWWGEDGGIGNFFINKEDLRNCNFDNVLYHWDCY